MGPLTAWDGPNLSYNNQIAISQGHKRNLHMRVWGNGEDAEKITHPWQDGWCLCLYLLYLQQR